MKLPKKKQQERKSLGKQRKPCFQLYDCTFYNPIIQLSLNHKGTINSLLQPFKPASQIWRMVFTIRQMLEVKKSPIFISAGRNIVSAFHDSEPDSLKWHWCEIILLQKWRNFSCHWQEWGFFSRASTLVWVPLTAWLTCGFNTWVISLTATLPNLVHMENNGQALLKAPVCVCFMWGWAHTRSSLNSNWAWVRRHCWNGGPDWANKWLANMMDSVWKFHFKEKTFNSCFKTAEMQILKFSAHF